MSEAPRPDRMTSALAADVARLYLREARVAIGREAPDYAKALKEIDSARFWTEEASRLRKAGR